MPSAAVVEVGGVHKERAVLERHLAVLEKVVDERQ